MNTSTNTVNREPAGWTLKDLVLAIVGGLGFIAFAGFVVIFMWAIVGH